MACKVAPFRHYRNRDVTKMSRSCANCGKMMPAPILIVSGKVDVLDVMGRPAEDLMQRVSEISAVVERIAAGDLEAVIPPGPPGDTLGPAIDRMRIRIHQLRDEISELSARLEEESRKQTLSIEMRERELSALRAVIDVATSAFGPKEFIQKYSSKLVKEVLERAIDVVGADSGDVLLFDEEREFLLPVARHGPSRLGGRELPPLESVLLGFHEAKCWPFRLYATWGERIAGLPVQRNGEPVGLLLVSRTKGKSDFDRYELSLLEIFVELVSMVVERGYEAGALREDQSAGTQEVLEPGLVSVFSHELRNPLGLIRASASMLRLANARASGKIVKEYITVIEQEADRLNSIIEDYLSSSVIVAGGKLQLNQKPLDIARLATRCVDRVSWSAGNDYVFSVDFPPDFPLLWADEVRVEQVLTNLLDNAVKYSPEGGAISIQGRMLRGADNRSARAAIFVKDEGIGIPPGDLENVFHKFFRVDSLLMRRTRGTGLGLAICKDIVESHGGKIWVDSEVGKGSAFVFALPSYPDHSDGGLVDGAGGDGKASLREPEIRDRRLGPGKPAGGNGR